MNAVIIPQNWEQYSSSGLRPSEGIAHQFFGMMTAFTNTSSPELPYSLSGSGAAVVAWKYCLSKIQGGGPLELLEVAENGRFAW